MPDKESRHDTPICGKCDIQLLADSCKTVHFYPNNEDSKGGTNENLPIQEQGCVKYWECPKCMLPKSVYFRNQWKYIEDLLADDTCSLSKETAAPVTLVKIRNDADYERLLILSQIIYNEYDCNLDNDDSPFLPIPRSEYAKLVWLDGQCVGFYSVKLRGHGFVMSTVDTVYIRKSFQRRGLGTAIIHDIIKEFGKESFGFSSPVSKALYGVLEKYLSQNAALRSKIWECSCDGSEGYRQNVWLNIKLSKARPLKRQRVE